MKSKSRIIFKDLKLEDLMNENLPQAYIPMVSILADYCHDTQYRILTGEPYSEHLKEVGGLARKTANPRYTEFLKYLFMLHDYNEDLEENKKRNKAHTIRKGSILTESFGDIGILSGQFIRLMNRKRMQEYLERKKIINEKTPKEEKFNFSVLGLTGKWGYPELEDLAYTAPSCINALLVPAKMFDMDSNTDRGKKPNIEFMKQRYKNNIKMNKEILLNDVKGNYEPETKIKTLDKYLKTLTDKFYFFKERNCRRIENIFPDLNIFLLNQDLFLELFEVNKFEKEMDMVFDSACKYLQSIPN